MKTQARRNTDAGSSPKCVKGFFSQSASSADCLTVSVQPLCAIACIICAHVFNPKPVSHTVVWTQENTALPDRNGMGSAALAYAALYPPKAIRISHKGQRITEKITIIITKQ